LAQLEAHEVPVTREADWPTISSAEQNRRLRHWVRNIIYDGAAQKVAINLHDHDSQARDQALLERRYNR
jgi:hypothetical protein